MTDDAARDEAVFLTVERTIRLMPKGEETVVLIDNALPAGSVVADGDRLRLAVDVHQAIQRHDLRHPEPDTIN